MKRSYLAYAAVPIAAIALLSAGIASAQGGFWNFGNATPADTAARFGTMFQEQADVLGVSVDIIKQGWADGKTLEQIAADQNIDTDTLQEQLRTKQRERMKAQLQTLVDQGVISQTQADARLQVMKARAQNGNRRGFGCGMGFGNGPPRQ